MKKFAFLVLPLFTFLSVSCSPVPQVATIRDATPSYAAFLSIDAPNMAAATPECSEACQKLRQEFRYVVYVGKQIYCYWDEKKAETGTDFDALASQLEQSITSKTTPTEYYVTLRHWAAAFHDGHVNVLLKSDHSDIELFSAPVRLEVLAPATDHEKVIVTEANIGSELKIGDEVTAIDGRPIKECIDDAVLQVSGSTVRMRRFFAARRLVDILGAARAAQPLELSITRESTKLQLTLERTADIAAKPTTPPLEKKRSGAEFIKAVVLPTGLGYLQIDAFAGTQSSFLLNQAIERLSATKGLLIDLRKNGGGDQSGNSILAHLIKTQITRYRTSERMSDYTLANRPEYYFLKWSPGALYADWHDLIVKPKEVPLYVDKPIVVLIGPNCFSACDTFTAALKANALATVVGEGSGGGTGTPLVFDLPHSEHRFRYSVIRGLTSKNETIEGTGTLPDIVIEPATADRAAAKDRQLAKALELLSTKASTPKLSISVESFATGSLPPIWTQGFEHSPTMSDEVDLRAIADSDEIAAAP